jgi:5-methylcytosine-specific restriction endonuclease McrA
MEQQTHNKLRHAQALLRHQVPSGDVAQVLDRALDALIEKLEKRKFAATSSPRPRRDHVSVDARHIPADVKREVWERDEGQCTYMSDSGRRCEECGFLEFDHMDPVALGGEASAERIRLRCRAHNQLEAELVFGPKFMARKREEARRAKAKERSA